MPVRRIIVQEVTNMNVTDSLTVTCENPLYSPVGPADPSECNVALYNVAFTNNPVPTVAFSYDAQLKYAYLQNGATFEQFCDVLNQSRAVTFEGDVSVCSDELFSITSSFTNDPSALTTTSSSVACNVTFDFVLNNLCAQTLIAVEDTIMP
ncbi:MAG: hypothetical protein ACOYVD_02745 [Bacillota bacterium]